MSLTSASLPKLSPVETLKGGSQQLRGSIGAELANSESAFTKPAVGLLKFHGIYQQDDRDIRKSSAQKSYTCMVRVSIPGGTILPSQYLALDRLADRVGDGTLRITSRQGIQYHYVGKRDLHSLIAGINEAGLSTFAACGDVVRNIIAPAAPSDKIGHFELISAARMLNRELKPRTAAYVEIWLDGEKAASIEDEAEPLYGETYLPRKFKIGLTLEGDNTTDIYSNDLGFVARLSGDRITGFTILAGGGMGQSNGIKDSHPRLADEIGFIQPEDLLAVAKAVVGIHRDFGNRSNRKLARLKYVLDQRGVEWFRAELESRLGKPLAPAAPLQWERHSDHFGWHPYTDKLFFGLRVVSGRIAANVRTAIREIVAELQPEVRFTSQQNVIFAGLTAEARPRLEQILRSHGVALPSELPPVLRLSMACPALPTCGLALTESERILPDITSDVQAELDRAGIGTESVHLRMTGCPNGCARPYTAEIGIVGQSVGLYSLYLGGSPLATRLATLYAHNIKREQIPASLRPIIDEFVAFRNPGEAFGDYCARQGVDALRSRHLEV